MKNVCVISPVGYSGISYYDYGLCHALSELGLEVDLFSVDNYIIGKTPNFHKLNLFIGTYGDISRIKKGLNYLKALIKSFFLILKKDYEIIHIQKMELPLIDCIFFALLKLTGRKIVYTPHDILPFKYIGLSMPVHLTYKLSDALIVHNKKNKDDLISLFRLKEQKISIIPHGNYNFFLKGIPQQEARTRLGLPEDKKIVLLFGNIRSRKGIETTISAVKYLKKRRDVLLLIVGKVSWEFDIERLKNMINDNGLEDFLLIRDEFVEDDLVEAYYRSSDVVVIPYEQGYESGVLKYAFSCELPVIVSDLPEFSDFTEDNNNCLIFKRGNYREIAEKIEILLDNTEIRQRISSNAKKLSDTEWGWDRSAAKIKKIYESLRYQ